MKAFDIDPLTAGRRSWILGLCYFCLVSLIVSISLQLHSNGLIALVAINVLTIALYLPAIGYCFVAWTLVDLQSRAMVHALLALFAILIPPILFLWLAASPGLML